VAELNEALGRTADTDSLVPAGVADVLAREHGWSGRLVDALAIPTEDVETLGYAAGGRRA
jgi:hypothetical protein